MHHNKDVITVLPYFLPGYSTTLNPISNLAVLAMSGWNEFNNHSFPSAITDISRSV